MSLGDVNLACACALVEELARAGVTEACISPGSRSTPIALALDRHPAVRTHVHLDERSSAFFAIGIAKATRRPVAVACTSGTAAAELFPAVVEASQSRTPLVLLTADRPPRLRGSGANQTIDQVNLYGRYARYLEPPVPSVDADCIAWRESGERAVDALFPTPGPVHLNLPFEEPLVPVEFARPTTSGEPRPPAPDPEAQPLPRVAERFAREISGARGVLVAGGSPSDLSSVARFFAERLRWPVLAEPTSGARIPGVALSAGQALVSSLAWVEENVPEVVVQVGATPTTRATQSFVASSPRLLVVDRLLPDPDPDGRATWRLHANPDDLVSSTLLTSTVEPAPESWLSAWRRFDARTQNVIDELLQSWEEPFEQRIARDVAAAIPDGGTLVTGSSMPIRDLDYAMAPRGGIRVFANRGASGVDGLVSTALGVAAARGGGTYALIGDLTFLHDVGALVWNARRGLDSVLVVINNAGGTIFGFLPQRGLPEFRRLFETPHGLDLGAISVAAGAGHFRVEHADDLPAALRGAERAEGIQVVEVRVDPDLNRERHAQVQAAVDRALRESS